MRVCNLSNKNEGNEFILECDGLLFWKKTFSLCRRDVARIKKLKRMAKKLLRRLPPEVDFRGWAIEREYVPNNKIGYQLAIKDGCKDIQWTNSFAFNGYGDGIEVCYCEGDYVKLKELNS
jgi:hypothetical protein